MKALIPQNFINSNAKILVAVSGGSDSIALLHILANSKENASSQLVAAHLNHCIRGSEADRDENGVVEICKKLNIKLVVNHIDIPTLAKETGESLEMAAHHARRSFLIDTAKENCCSYIATGHTADDKVETLFLRLLKGAGLRGLSTIREQKVDDNLSLIRPIINYTHSELQEYLKSLNVKWFEDSTNADDSILRNKIRLHLVPYMKNLFGDDFASPLLRTIDTISETSDYIEEIANTFIATLPNYPTSFDTKQISTLSPVISKLVIRNWLIDNKIPSQAITKYIIEEILHTCQRSTHGTSLLSVYKDIYAKRTNDSLYIVKNLSDDTPSFEHIIPLDNLSSNPTIFSPLYITPELSITLSISSTSSLIKPKRSFPSLENVSCTISLDELKKENISNLVVRPFKNGDKITLAGSKITQKLSDIFINNKIPRDKRKTIPLLSTPNGEIVWIPGYGIDKKFATQENQNNIYINLNSIKTEMEQ